MERKEKVRLLIGVTINLAILVLEILCLIQFILHSVYNNTDNKFRYFTNISNISIGLIALANLFILIFSLLKGKVVVPKWFSIIKVAAISMTTLTFMVVLCVLAPATSYLRMYKEAKFITHLVAPLLALISYLFFEEKALFEWKYSVFSFIPFFIYSIVYITNVVFLSTWKDIYQINANGIWYVFLLLAYIVNFGVVQGVYFLKILINKLMVQKSSLT